MLPPPRARQRFRPVEENLGRASYPQQARPRPTQTLPNQVPLLHKEVDGPVITSPPQIDDTPTTPLPVITESLLQQHSPTMVTLAKAMVTMAEVHPNTQPQSQTRAAANQQWLKGE